MIQSDDTKWWQTLMTQTDDTNDFKK
jgi:hypothetical protein